MFFIFKRNKVDKLEKKHKIKNITIKIVIRIFMQKRGI